MPWRRDKILTGKIKEERERESNLERGNGPSAVREAGACGCVGVCQKECSSLQGGRLEHITEGSLGQPEVSVFKYFLLERKRIFEYNFPPPLKAQTSLPHWKPAIQLASNSLGHPSQLLLLLELSTCWDHKGGWKGLEALVGWVRVIPVAAKQTEAMGKAAAPSLPHTAPRNLGWKTEQVGSSHLGGGNVGGAGTWGLQDPSCERC